ncbi:MAG: type II secretion system protein GspD [Deltaproteobacteria bacterium]|nr:MAG: type II secretion system protein GspD [Deltaproteobacteria bacterium]
MNVKEDLRRRLSRSMVAIVAAATMCIGTTASAAPPRGRPTAPRASTGPAAPGRATPPAGPELSGDESGVLPHNTCRKQPRNAKFTITLPREAELADLVNWMMTISCQRFIWDPKIRSGKVTILSPEPVTVREAYAAFYAALEQMGLTVVPSGKYFKIVESTGVEGKTVPVYGPKGRAPNNDRYVTQLYRVQSGDAQAVADVVGALKSKQGNVRVVGDMLIITDTGSSIRRLLRIVRQVDEAARPTEKIFFYQLQYADPTQVAAIIQEIFPASTTTTKKKTASKSKRSKGKKTATLSIGGAAPSAAPSVRSVIVDERTGTIVVVAEPQDFAVIRKLIQQLDVPLAGGASDRIHVVRLRHADPEKVAQVLQQLATGAQSKGKKGGKGKQAPAAAAATLFSGDIKVAADPATRSLVILASQTDFFSLRPVIEKLDAERLSVYIEVYLMELTIGRTLQAGAAGHFGAPINTDQGQGLGFVATAPGINSIQPTPDLLSGILGGVLGPQIPGSGQFFGLGQDIPAFGVIIQALQSNNDVNVVAEPHLFTADNQEAVIEVGKTVPTPGNLAFPGGAGGQGGLVPVQGINRQPVKLTVKITPHINDDKTVTMDVEMEDQDIESIDQILGVTTSERRIELNQIVAHDDQPLVLGGLVRETERETTAQVPGLGSIPVLGWLFKRKRKEKVRTNLLMILVPHIITSPDDVRRIHARRTAERIEFLERTSFKRREIATHVNYRNKRGLVASIEREAERMEEELERLRQVEQELLQESVTGELDMTGRLEGEDGEGGDGGASSSAADGGVGGGAAGTADAGTGPAPASEGGGGPNP